LIFDKDNFFIFDKDKIWFLIEIKFEFPYT